MCDSIVAAPSRTAGGNALFAKNSDRMAGECQPFVQFPAAFYPRGASLECTHLTIPQVAETFALMGHSPWWVWGFEQGVNEHAVAIGNQAVFSKEPIETEPGLIGMDLVRLGLERARTAREAVEVIAGLVERHGQGGAAFSPEGSGYHNSFVVVDAKEACVLGQINPVGRDQFPVQPLGLHLAGDLVDVLVGCRADPFPRLLIVIAASQNLIQ